ncbi:MAG: zinc ribbon domain-containing protein [Actinomycetota bacterium]
MPDVEQSALLRLLDLQSEDSAVKRLTEQRASLPEAARLQEVQDHLAELESDLEIAKKQDEEIGREQHRLEGEIELVDQKIAKEEQRLFSGGVSNPKELGNLQAEVASLKKRKSDLEDQDLEVMEQRESSSATLAKLTNERDDLSKEEAELGAKVSELNAEIDTNLQAHSATRDEIAAEIDADLLALYDKIRAAKSGVGAAALEAGTCQGCHTKLAQADYERIRAEGGLQRCDHCRRILVIR